MEKTKDGDISWLSHGDLIGDEGETQRGLALEAAAVLAHVAASEERLMQNEMRCRSAAPDSLYSHF